MQKKEGGNYKLLVKAKKHAPGITLAKWDAKYLIRGDGGRRATIRPSARDGEQWGEDRR